MNSFFDITLDLVSQFTGGRGGIEHGIVQCGLGAALWATLLFMALSRRQNNIFARERMLAWGFSFGLGRECFMLFMVALQAYGLVDGQVLHVVFPPFEHALFDLAIVIVAAAFLRYLLDDVLVAKRFLWGGILLVLICYLLTFWWWGRHIIFMPDSTFGQTWCDWLFHMNASVLLAMAITIMCLKTKGWMRNVVCLALFFIFLYEFLKIPDMAFGETYENLFAPIRHGFYLAAIPLFGYVYVRSFWEEREWNLQLIRESGERYRSIFENSNDAICTYNNDDMPLAFNQAMLDLLGFTEEEMKKMFASDFITSRSEMILFQHEMYTHGAVQDYDLQFCHKDGSDRHCRVSATVTRNGSTGEVNGYQAIIRDMTERNSIEQQMRQAGKMEAIGTLAGGISHDFNNILAAILGYTKSAMRLTNGNKQVNDMHRQILRSSYRARDLVRQILTYSRKSSHKPMPVDVVQLAGEVVDLVRVGMQSNVHVTRDFCKDCLKILADPTQIHQALMNICTNAMLAMDKNGKMVVRLKNISFSAAESSDFPADLEPGKYVMVEITDNGHGMDSATRERIFDPFFTTRGVNEGTGMGLATVQGVIAAHSGAITVSSMLGQGSTFTLYLPAVIDTTEVKPAADGDLARGDEHILIVDDVEVLANYEKMFFEELGYSVTSYSDSELAYDFFQNNPQVIDLIITDKNMPRMSGLELAEKISQIQPGLPIILCSGYNSGLDENCFSAAGVSEFVLKPFDEKEIAELVREVLDNRLLKVAVSRQDQQEGYL